MGEITKEVQERRLKWYGHVMRIEENYVGRRAMVMKGPSPYSSMPDIIISATVIEHILSNLKPQKAAGPDTIPPTVLKELSHQIAPILEIIFNKSLQTGQVPNDWKEANVAPIFKKGDKHNPCNYRHISLTCIIRKCMEHILVSNIMQHLDSNKILYALLHGFRKNIPISTSHDAYKLSLLPRTIIAWN